VRCEFIVAQVYLCGKNGSSMNAQQKRLLEIGSNLMGWGIEFFKLLQRAGEINKMTDLPAIDRTTIVEAAERLGKLFAEVSKANELQSAPTEIIDHLIASYDRLCEETAQLNEKIDRLLASRKA
jgi:methyl-accepting chemotaxis protein